MFSGPTVFSGISGNAAIATTTFMDGSGLSAGGGGSATAYRYPTSARTFKRIRLTAPVGTPSTAVTATLYKNGAPTAMTCTIASGQPAGTQASDVAHPIAFVDGDDFDLVLTQPITPEGPGPYSASLEG